ncbi:amidohydrolase family protein [Idiomarina seosinensis]|uniref:Amidohydrolase n=1 Tax=Idiomarina seosinensis TaxID=281739 RepID=A0A432ZDZ1_9GAMM|nr:amidohydrolase family protein [Idiomarina seosinensis]RUO76183.1 amidohydrolase [Idiomarina seosinensis]
MSPGRGLFIFLMAALVSACQQAQTSTTTDVDADMAVINANIVTFNGREGQLLSQRAVLIKDDEISQVVPMALAENLPESVRLVDANDGYVLAGFTEMHGHVPPATDFGQLPKRYADDMLFLYLANGVTTVRGMLGYPHQLQLKRDIEAGERTGPTLYLAGPSFNGNTVESVEQATSRVIEQRQQGWDLLKIHPGLTLQEYRALAETAREHNMDFAGHVPKDVGLEVALQEGQRTIDHMDGYLEYVDAIDRPITEQELQELVDLTLEYDVGVVPTQALWSTLIGAEDPESLAKYPELDLVPESVRDGWVNYYQQPSMGYFNQDNAIVQQDNRQQLLKALHDAGAKIIFGTDAPQLFSVPGFSIHHEIRKMREAGIPLADIYYYATAAAGNYFEDNDQFGQISKGQRADFMVLKNNPLQSADALKTIQGVMARGEWLAKQEIDRKLEEIRAAYQ